MAWLNLIMPNQTVKNGLKAKKIKLHQMNFVLEKQLIKFSCTYYLFLSAKLLSKQSYSWFRVVRMCTIFETKTAHSSCSKIFWYKPLLLLSSTYWPFHCAKFLKNRTLNPELWWCAIFGPKVAHLLQFFFLKLLLSFSCTY